MSRTDVNATNQPIAPFQQHDYRVIRANRTGVPPLDRWTSGNVIVSNISGIYRKGTVNPNYVKLRATGNLPPNAFDFHRRNWTPRTGWYKQVARSTGVNDYDDVTERTGCISGTQVAGYFYAQPSSLVILNVTNQAKQKALLKIKDQDVNLAEVWGERHESLNMIRNNVDRIGKTYAALKHGDFRGAAAALGVKPRRSGFDAAWRKSQSKAIANGWLELQYGWRPLIMDIHGALEALHKSLSDDPKMEMRRVVGTSQFSDSTVTTSAITAGTLTRTRNYRVDVKCCVYYRRVSRTLHTLAALGITNPLYVAWELTKYSFVVDWLVHVGNYLSSLDATLGYQFAFGCITTATLASETLDWSVAGTVSFNVTRNENSTERDEYFGVSRSALTNWPSPGLPTLKDPASLEHALNAIALLRQSHRK